jgi:microcystin-dependent protein
MTTFEKRAGELVWYYGTTPPWGTLPCDGASYLKTDYPELWDVLETETYDTPPVLTFEVDSTHFKTPDLDGVVLMAVVSTAEKSYLVDGWGAAEHTLTVAEMPAHTHTEKAAVVGTNNYQGGTNRDGTTYSTPNTGSTGGGGAFSLYQPSNNARIGIRYT